MTMTEAHAIKTKYLNGNGKFVVDNGNADMTGSTGSSFHIPPPAASRMKGGSANTKRRTVQAISKSIFVDNRNINTSSTIKSQNDKNNNKATTTAVSSNTFWKSENTNYFKFTFYKIVLAILFFMFGIFRYGQLQYNKSKLKILDLLYNPSNTPQLIRQDVVKLNKIPSRLAAILEVKPIGDVGGGLKGILNDASELVSWTISAGVKHLSLYDYDGVLQKNTDELRNAIYEHLSIYYGPANVPNFAIRIPHFNKVLYNKKGQGDIKSKVAIEVSLLSNRDGRETIVDLTRTMAELCSNKELNVDDITVDLVDTELKQLVGQEPDLLLYFGPSLDLQGYPPWHIRLTEFFWEEDNNQVTYSVFIRGLKQYAGCKVNVGK
ncbi:similar to Saccharomyces cerevisiae YDL193W NUS1 Putative prenyltransferase, required for cell viability [Maudiozyma barnettii]|uniref:ditrans,polycis-polyprenyl diphosphate synthase [(2E,6E)-farnesyldiphosphate specific] n=1 Tax=Maudiozyma barnettii TaxID=61262 RepID=A0A8H2VEB4_9SACH|nr:ditrans,polycis-polyprenyl diphosphate synthase [Kazachstania barnettii]CAB4253980.1 similar to Saccharomyces cerevisiae YDL193W NUS1 Putative prenyltransferase, required for cell viability [Kazachstania barnettii]CAD1781730.1 similar to Saccharomyces cerevisiae YDL193W NUS1 Putative prenyltransferase, required for cell viability [Kazachstania barnettii]